MGTGDGMTGGAMVANHHPWALTTTASNCSQGREGEQIDDRVDLESWTMTTMSQ